MGTSGAYGGSGGRDGKAVRDAVADQIGGGSPESATPNANERPPLDPAAIQHIVNLIRPRTPTSTADGPGGGGGGRSGGGQQSRTGGGGPQRSAARAASSASRAAAGAYAYRTGDAATLQRLGLNYDELRTLGDDFEVLRRIVDMACSASDSTIEDHEQRLVAADIGTWAMGMDGTAPNLEEIVRHAIGLIIAEALLSEAGDVLNRSDQPLLIEQDIRDAAEALAGRAELSVEGATEAEIAKAIESGIETLRDITGGAS